MATILLKKSSLTDISNQLKRMQSETEDARKKVNSAIRGLNFEVASKENIKTTMSKLNSTLSRQTSLSERYKTAFADIFNSIKETDGKLGNESSILLDGIKDYIDDSVSSIKDFLIGTKLAKAADVSEMFLQGKSTAEKTKVSFLSKLVNFGEKIVDDITDKTKEVYGNVVRAGKNCVSLVDDVKEWCVEHEDAIKAYGTGILKVAAGTVKVAGSIAAIIGTGGASIPTTMLTAIGGINDIASGAADLVYAYYGQYDLVGTTNALKEQVVDGATQIGEALGDAETGEKVGEWIYAGYNAVSFLDGAKKMLDSLGKVNTVVTGQYGTSSSFYWDVEKTSFEAIENSKIKFEWEVDYFVRKIMKVSPSSTGNLIYEAGKNVCKMFSKAAKLGKEIGGLI